MDKFFDFEKDFSRIKYARSGHYLVTKLLNGGTVPKESVDIKEIETMLETFDIENKSQLLNKLVGIVNLTMLNNFELFDKTNEDLWENFLSKRISNYIQSTNSNSNSEDFIEAWIQYQTAKEKLKEAEEVFFGKTAMADLILLIGIINNSEDKEFIKYCATSFLKFNKELVQPYFCDENIKEITEKKEEQDSKNESEFEKISSECKSLVIDTCNQNIKNYGSEIIKSFLENFRNEFNKTGEFEKIKEALDRGSIKEYVNIIESYEKHKNKELVISVLRRNTFELPSAKDNEVDELISQFKENGEIEPIKAFVKDNNIPDMGAIKFYHEFFESIKRGFERKKRNVYNHFCADISYIGEKYIRAHRSEIDAVDCNIDRLIVINELQNWLNSAKKKQDLKFKNEINYSTIKNVRYNEKKLINRVKNSEGSNKKIRLRELREFRAKNNQLLQLACEVEEAEKVDEIEKIKLKFSTAKTKKEFEDVIKQSKHCLSQRKYDSVGKGIGLYNKSVCAYSEVENLIGEINRMSAQLTKRCEDLDGDMERNNCEQESKETQDLREHLIESKNHMQKLAEDCKNAKTEEDYRDIIVRAKQSKEWDCVDTSTLNYCTQKVEKHLNDFLNYDLNMKSLIKSLKSAIDEEEPSNKYSLLYQSYNENGDMLEDYHFVEKLCNIFNNNVEKNNILNGIYNFEEALMYVGNGDLIKEVENREELKKR